MSVDREQALRGALRIGADEAQLLAYVLKAVADPQPDAEPVAADQLPAAVPGQDAATLDQAVGWVAEALPKLTAAARLLMIRTTLPDTPQWRALDYDVRRLVAEHAPRQQRAS